MQTIVQKQGWWLALAILVTLAGGLRLSGYDFGLPYVEHLDEPNWYLIAREWRDPQFQGFTPYLGDPPVYIALHVVVQTLLENMGQTGLAPTVSVMRLIAVCVSVVTLVVIAHTARLIAGDYAGLVAGAVWGLTPVMLLNGLYALPDPLVYGMVALALWLATIALIDERRSHWCVWSVAAGLLAILLKYPVLCAVFPGGLAALMILRKNRRLGLRYLLFQALLVVGTVIFLLLYLDFGQFENEAAAVRSGGLENLLQIGWILSNINQAIRPLNALVFGVITLIGVVSLWRTERVVRLDGLLLALVMLLTIPWFAAAISDVATNSRLRDVLPATGAAAIIMGALLAQIVQLFPRRRWGYVFTGLPLLGLVLLPDLVLDWQQVRQLNLPDRRVALREWFDTNLEPGTILVTEDNHKTFNPFWGGIPHKVWFDWYQMDQITEQPLDVWRDERGISYAVLPYDQTEALEQSPDGQVYLDQMLHLRDFKAPPAGRGPEVAVYRLWRMEQPVDVQFADNIRLIGYDLRREPGHSLTLRFYWQNSAPPTENYSLFVHLIPADAYEVLAQVDAAPGVSNRPTLTWDVANEVHISPWYTLEIPPDLPLGDYRVLIGLYNYLTGIRLPVEHAPGAVDQDGWLLTCLTTDNWC